MFFRIVLILDIYEMKVGDLQETDVNICKLFVSLKIFCFDI